MVDLVSSSPTSHSPIASGAGDTPLLAPAGPTLSRLGIGSLRLKAEYRNPTGSFKDRIADEAAQIIARDDLRGAIGTSSGNGGAAIAAIGARAGFPVVLFTTSGIVDGKLARIAAYGATVCVLHDIGGASLEDVAVLDNRGGEEILHGIDFRAEPGEVIALVGSSGSGKSTLASLMPRLYDIDSGAIRVGGVDVREATKASLRRTVGMVTQDGHLFHDTVRANLRIAKTEASDTEIWDALRRARLLDTVEELPDELDTVIGDRGYRLSGGERQRLTIARLLLQEPAVVVLDEATSALDSTNEAAIQEALNEAMADRTALVIAHRLSTVRAASEILVLEDGYVVERGTHTELLAADGRYAELYHVQFADESIAEFGAAEFESEIGQYLD